MQQVAGARRVDVNLDKQAAMAVFDPTAVDETTLREAIARAGYTPKSETVVAG